MRTNNQRTHNKRFSNVGIPEAQCLCARCGVPCERKYCSIDCYRAVQRSGSGADRFWAMVRQSDGCWQWTGSLTTRGYGQILWDGRPTGAHRVAWILAHGAIPDGLFVCHRCDNRYCVRASHLFLGTQDDNMKDAAQKGRLNTPRPRKQTITDEQCAEMLSLRRAGMTLQDIADRFGVTKAYVSMLVRGKRRQYSDLDAATKSRTA